MGLTSNSVLFSPTIGTKRCRRHAGWGHSSKGLPCTVVSSLCDDLGGWSSCSLHLTDADTEVPKPLLEGTVLGLRPRYSDPSSGLYPPHSGHLCLEILCGRLGGSAFQAGVTRLDRQALPWRERRIPRGGSS